ncbi:hypothetical protein BS78_06G165500 [Paspalum vaginatum]|nr:hypothetical protein BS78_06G165500 [Paspalum vaginatum]
MSSASSQTFPWRTEQEANGEAETNAELYEHFASLVASLPSSKGMLNPVYRHDQGWHAPMDMMVGAMVADACFTARPSDIIVATLPKSGTTWIKSLLYATVHREEHPVDDADGHPFNSVGPHECIKFLEYQIYSGGKIPDLDKLPDPRLFATHVPFVALPRTIMTASCKIVYVCRDPKDTVISWWHFINKFRARAGMDPLSAESAAELFCDGMSGFGPYWDHVLGYWRAYLAHPEQVLFFRYEEMQRDPAAHVRRLAEFVGLPFGAGREEDAVVDAIVSLCSFKHMSGLKATKGGMTDTSSGALENNSFFRRGMVGDWANHLTPETARRIDGITKAKFKGSGLSV